MKKLFGMSVLLGTLAAPLAMSTPSLAWDCHCHPHVRHVVYYKPVYYRAIRYKAIYTNVISHHCYHHRFHYTFNPYPNVFIENAHVYVPPTYYYSPYTYVDRVLVHRSTEIGPLVPVVASPPAVVTAAALVLP